MHPSPTAASPAVPAFVLALALLGALAAVGSQVLIQMRMVPGTVLTAGAEAAMGCAERLRQCLKAANFDATSQGLRVSASFGVATAQDGDAVDDIVKRCDLALYRAKSEGRDRVMACPWGADAT